MSTKFTPGPWRDGIMVPMKAVHCERIGYTIGFVNGHAEEEACANAHLIAAAPELYAALEAACDLMAQEDFATLTLVPKLRAALARARGEQ